MQVFLIDEKFQLSPAKDTVDINELDRTHIFGLSGKKHHCKFWVKYCYYPQYSI